MGKRSIFPRICDPRKGECGKKLYNDEFGEWRSVPGFESNVLIVSSCGFVRRKPRRDRQMGKAFKPKQQPEGYRSVVQDGNPYRVCRLVLWAFKGGPDDNQTADHLAKYNGDFMKERGDDRIENLKWSSKKEQAENRCIMKKQRRSVPVFARHLTWTSFSPSIKFESCLTAAKTLGLNQGNISNVLGNTRKVSSTGGWSFAWALEDNSNLLNDEEGDEKWLFVGTRRRCKVSNFGRYQTMKGRGNNWGPKIMPVATRGKNYPTLRVDGKLMYVHHLVWNCFGHRNLRMDETIDHINRDTNCNRISNLRPATKSEQLINQTRHGSNK